MFCCCCCCFVDVYSLAVRRVDRPANEGRIRHFSVLRSWLLLILMAFCLSFILLSFSKQSLFEHWRSCYMPLPLRSWFVYVSLVAPRVYSKFYPLFYSSEWAMPVALLGYASCVALPMGLSAHSFSFSPRTIYRSICTLEHKCKLCLYKSTWLGLFLQLHAVYFVYLHCFAVQP